ncbi:MAG: hypothetical protein PHG66_00075 [Candidatus Colwellbacteria bacterium]|nr:hypothetical protein [Candidatus Colwellbacteria bacterium]
MANPLVESDEEIYIELVKTCYICEDEKNLSQFADLRNGQETKMCLDCRVQRLGYKTTANRAKDVVESHKDKCELCGDDDMSHIHFDHIDPKEKYKNVTAILKMESLLIELDKVRTICGKCHARHTRSQRDIEREERDNNIDETDKRLASKRKRKERNRKYVDEVKVKIGGCQMEGCTDVFDNTILSFYEFDHIDVETKSYMISNMAGSTYSTERIQKEIDKCRMLCQYCHRKRTNIQYGEKSEKFKTVSEPTTKTKRVVAKLNKEIVKRIREDYCSGELREKDMMEKYGVSRACINNVVRNTSWIDETYIPPDFKTRHHKLTDEQRQEIYDRYNNEDVTKTQLGKDYGVSNVTIANVLNKFNI